MARLGRSYSALPALLPSTRRWEPGAAAEDARIAELNPWWFTTDWAASDPHLRRLRSQPRTFPARVVDRLRLDAAGVHTIRGPRQVGKSTDLKLLIERALREGQPPNHIVYLACDLLEAQPALALTQLIQRAKVLANASGRGLLLLDEVSVVERWQTVVKDLWDRGVIDDDVVVVTSSSAIDLARGKAESLPGRRGAGRDHLALPQSFDVFASAIDPTIPPSPALTLREIFTADGQRALASARMYGPRLREAFDRYLRFGGLPAAVAEATTGLDEPTEDTRRILWDSLVREVSRKGASEPATRALLERVLRSLGSKTNWSRMAREMDVPLGRGKRGAPDHKTLQDYIEFLALGYFLLIVYFWRQDADSNAVAKDKKIYFGDPLLHTLTRDGCCPGREVDVPALVENAVALALYRQYEPRGSQLVR